MGLRINHVSVNARDLQESVAFYVDLLGAEPLTTPNFGLPVQWLALACVVVASVGATRSGQVLREPAPD